jgi:hypothetical protein
VSVGWVPRKDTTSLLLQRLGFPDDSVFPVVRAAERLIVAAKIEGDDAVLILDTGMRLDVYLDRSYVERRGFTIEWLGDRFGVCPTGDFVVLGRQRVFHTATVQALPTEKGYDPAYAGTLGTMFFNDGLLGLDWASGEIARTSQHAAIRALLPDPTHRLGLLPNVQDGVPFTRSLRIDGLRTTPTFAVASGRSSWISARVANRTSSQRHSLDEIGLARNEKFDVPLVFPNTTPMQHSMRIHTSIEQYGKGWGVPECDKILGGDFLRRWLVVLDIPAGQLLLYDYARVLPELKISRD